MKMLLALTVAARMFDLVNCRTLQLLLAPRQPATLAESSLDAALATVPLGLALPRMFQTQRLLAATAAGYALGAAIKNFPGRRKLQRPELGTPDTLAVSTIAGP